MDLPRFYEKKQKSLFLRKDRLFKERFPPLLLI